MVRYKQALLVFIVALYGISAFSQEKDSQNFSFSNNIVGNKIILNYVDDRIYIPANIEEGVKCSLFLDSEIKNVSLDSTFVARNKTKLGLIINPHPNYVTSLEGVGRFYQALFVWSKDEDRKRDLKIQIGNNVVSEEHPIVSNQNDDKIGSGIFPLYLLAKTDCKY